MAMGFCDHLAQMPFSHDIADVFFPLKGSLDKAIQERTVFTQF